jgi:ATP-dependent protease ClpP protease subunit
LKSIEKALDRDTFMIASDSKEFGIIDKVVDTRELTPEEEDKS